MSNSTSTINSDVQNEVLAEEAYKRVLPEITAIAADQVIRVQVDVIGATATVLGARPRILPLRGQLQTEVPSFNVALLDKVEDYAYALMYANAVHQTASEPDDALPDLLAQADLICGKLQLDASALAARGLIDPDSIKKLSARSGYKNTASDLQLLVTVLSTNWGKIAGKCGTEKSELDLASRLAGRIVRLVGLREHSPAAVADASDKRARAYTLLVKTWDQIRRGVTFLRWNDGDADEIAPSLYANRTTYRTNEREEPTTAPTALTPNQPTPGTQVTNVNIPGGSPFLQ